MVTQMSCNAVLFLISQLLYTVSYRGFELSSNDSAAENKESQFTDKFKYFCMKMYCKGSSNRGSQHIIFLWGEGG